MIDPAELSIAAALFSSVADEMGVTLGRTAHSPNIKERRDYSCAVFDPRGRLVAQAAHIPVHLGAMPESVAAALPLAPFAPGDIVILNDPYLGGTHLPDITMVSPVFLEASVGAHHDAPLRGEGTLIGFLASRAHHADVGGISPGSMPIAEELIQEGIVIPPIKLFEAGKLNQAVLDLLLRNMRAPGERRGDLDAQIAAHRTGEDRLREIAARYGTEQACASWTNSWTTPAHDPRRIAAVPTAPTPSNFYDGAKRLQPPPARMARLPRAGRSVIRGTD
jgi:N-methylhydantoinase B